MYYYMKVHDTKIPRVLNVFFFCLYNIYTIFFKKNSISTIVILKLLFLFHRLRRRLHNINIMKMNIILKHKSCLDSNNNCYRNLNIVTLRIFAPPFSFSQVPLIRLYAGCTRNIYEQTNPKVLR